MPYSNALTFLYEFDRNKEHFSRLASKPTHDFEVVKFQPTSLSFTYNQSIRRLNYLLLLDCHFFKEKHGILTDFYKELLS